MYIYRERVVTTPLPSNFDGLSYRGGGMIIFFFLFKLTAKDVVTITRSLSGEFRGLVLWHETR